MQTLNVQTLKQIRELLQSAGLAPRKQFGQNFLIDLNLMAKVVDLADPSPEHDVLEVGPGTGSLTEELLDRAARVIAVEIDDGLAPLLQARFADRPHFQLLHTDVLAGKRSINPDVLAAVAPATDLVSNLPYNIATPLLIECMRLSWHACAAAPQSPGGPSFRRLTFTVQREVADRLCAGPVGKEYGPVSVVVPLLGRLELGAIIPASAFWPRPNVESRLCRIDFDPIQARELRDVELLLMLLSTLFGHRRKQLGWNLRRKDLPFETNQLGEAFDHAGLVATQRIEQVEPAAIRAVVNALADAGGDTS